MIPHVVPNPQESKIPRAVYEVMFYGYVGLSESVRPDSAVHMTRTGGWCLIASASVIYLDNNVVDANDSNSQALQSAQTYDIISAGY